MNIEKLLKLFAEHEIQHLLSWTDDLEFSVSCNDFFVWGCADCEFIETDEDIEVLRESLELTKDLGSMLYCARHSGMRPQGAFYKYIPEELWPLFDVCGPKREIGAGNPVEH